MLKRNLFEKQMIALKTFLWTRKLQFWQPSRSNPRKGRLVFAQCPKKHRDSSAEKKFTSKIFNGPVQSSFEDLIEKFWRKSQKLFSRDPKIVKKHTSKENYFPNFSYRHIKINFDHHNQKLMSEGCKSIYVRNWEENTFSKNKCSSKNVTMDTYNAFLTNLWT